MINYKKNTSLIGLLLLITLNVNSQTLYWIGNSGTWSDTSHWSTTSGGLSCSCLPAVSDSVVFDSNSFTGGGQSVTIGSQAYCKDMTWVGVPNPTLAGSGDLDIYGSLTLSPSMNIIYTGNINFRSNNGNATITTSGKMIRSNITFNGAGAWTLQDSLRTNENNIMLVEGALNTNGQYINAYYLQTSGNNVKSLALGNSTIVLSSNSNSGSYYAWMPGGSGLSFNSGTSHLIFTGNGQSYFFAGNGFNYYDINFSNGTGTGYLYGSNNNIFHNVSFLSDANISGDNTFNDLTLGASHVTTVNQTQMVNGVFTCNGSCSVPSTLTGGIISKPNGTISINYVRLQNVTATGGATFIANNVTDFGGNNGWTLNNPVSQTLYWIGNGGNWNEPFHWSTTSGGISSGCVPSPYDSVVFDSNSFTGGGQSVTISSQAYCKDMTWVGVPNPTLAGSVNIDIYGSLVLSPTMNIIYTGNINFRSNNGNATITTSGKMIRSNITFNGAGAWTLQDSLRTNENNIMLVEGALNTNGQYINAYYLQTSGSNVKSLTLGNSTIVLSSNSNSGSYYAWMLGGSGLSFNAGASHLIFTGNGQSYFFAGTGFNYYDINFSNGTGTGYLYGSNNNIFHNVSFLSDANISGDNTFNDLTLGPNHVTTVNQTQIVNGTFTCNGSCSVPSTLTGGIISKPNGTISINYVRLQNVTATGGATFIANNVTDFGGNNGWTLNNPVSQTLYWIGNGGNWNEPFHWSTTSGGISSGCIPSPYDNVVFDSNSFTGGGQSVTISAQAYCKDMTWTNVTNPTLTGSSDLDIYGSLALSPTMNIIYTGNINFRSNNGNATITTSGKMIRSNITFNGAGAWTLQDSLRTNENNIMLMEGTLNTNGQYINAYYFQTSGNGIKSLSLGSSTIVLSSNSNSFNYIAWQHNGSNLSFNAGTSHLVFTGSGQSYFFAGTGFIYYDVSFNNTSGTAYLYGSSNTVFHNVSFTNDAIINGDNTFNILNLSSGKYYTLGSNSVTKIIDNLNANGSQLSNTSIVSSSVGTHSTLNKISGSVCLEYVTFRDITVTGGVTFTASVGCIDNGNNSGIAFGSCANQLLRIDFMAPAVGGNTGEITVNIYGVFNGNPILRFTKLGESDIVFVDSMTHNINNVRLRGTTSLVGKAIGLWNAVVEIPGDTTMQLTNAFTIAQGITPTVTTQIIGSPTVRTNTWHNFSISYTNNGNINATGVPIWLVFPSTAQIEILSAKYEFPAALGMDTLNGVFPIDSLDGLPIGNDSLVCFIIANIPPQSTGNINFRLKSNASGNVKLYSWASRRLYASPFNPGIGACIDEVVSALVPYVPIPGFSCSYTVLRALVDPAITYANTNSNDELLIELTSSLVHTAIECAFDLSPISTAYKVVKALENLDATVSFYQSCAPVFIADFKMIKELTSVNSIDPNDKSGPVGAGPQNYCRTDHLIPYQIRFENVDSATAPVQNVTVIDSIKGNKFDFSTFEFGFISIVDTVIVVPPGQKSIAVDHYMPPPVDVVMRLNASFDDVTGIATWNFASLDPITLQPVSDPLKGFLHPNINSPEGEGAVFFSIKTLNTLPQNAVFDNKATIVFDNNPPISTNTWSNTVDRIPPVSSVNPLIPIQVDTNFLVSWSSTDIGSGTKQYTIYYSVNGGSYRPWLINTSTSSEIFHGLADSTYRFFSIATDSAGNIEPPHSSADAITTISLNTLVYSSGPNAFSIDIYPNPSKDGNFTLVIKNKKRQLVRLSVYNLLDQLCAEDEFLTNEEVTNKEVALKLNEGIYVLNIRSEDATISKKLIIKK